jgi:hypothetical protein
MPPTEYACPSMNMRYITGTLVAAVRKAKVVAASGSERVLVGAVGIESQATPLSPTASRRCNRPPGTIGTISTKQPTVQLKLRLLLRECGSVSFDGSNYPAITVEQGISCLSSSLRYRSSTEKGCN